MIGEIRESEVGKEFKEINIPTQVKPLAEGILDSRAKKKTSHKIYMEHLVKWKNLPITKATWVAESHFKKLGISMDLLPLDTS